MVDGNDAVSAGPVMTRRGLLLMAGAVPAMMTAQTKAGPSAVQPLPYPAFEYPKPEFKVREVRAEKRGDVTVRDITYTGTWNQRVAAYLVDPPKRGRKARNVPGILWVHWYEPDAKDSNRTQFLDQAVELAKDGAASLLIETMWSDPAWFKKRNPEDDYLNSIHQVHELRRALDLLQVQKRVDRLAYVGHDFGAMFGAVLPAADSRVSAFAFQAGAPRFSDWYLLGRNLDDAGRSRVIQKFLPLDPINFVGKASPARVLWQFGKQDRYVPAPRAMMLIQATREPKDSLWYDAGHALNEQAVRDRQEWLRKYLKLETAQT